MLTKNKIIEFLKANKSDFSQKFNVETIALFGSYARDEATTDSDIDIVVEMPASFDNFFDLKYFLEEEFQRKVDLTKMKNIRKLVQSRIQSELIYV